MAVTGRAEMIRAIFAAYLANDRERVEDALSDDFRFTSPFDDSIDKPTYFERCWKNADWIERHELEKIFVEGDEAFVTYRCVAKGGKYVSQYRVLRLRRRQGEAHRRLFRCGLRQRRVRQANGLAFADAALSPHGEERVFARLRTM